MCAWLFQERLPDIVMRVNERCIGFLMYVNNYRNETARPIIEATKPAK